MISVAATIAADPANPPHSPIGASSDLAGAFQARGLRTEYRHEVRFTQAGKYHAPIAATLIDPARRFDDPVRPGQYQQRFVGC